MRGRGAARRGGTRALLAAAALSTGRSESSSQCLPGVLSRYHGGWPLHLDWGLYWFGPGDATEKATHGGRSQFFDPRKNTVIYFHGWMGTHGGSTKICKRVTTRCIDPVCPRGTGQSLADRWLQDGWNVGYFYWDQFSDEECARRAEQKIWFDRRGDGFRWRSFDVATGSLTYQRYEGEAVSLADLCVSAMHTAMGEFTGEHVRFVGHSIGAQLAVRCAAMLHEENHAAAPQRLALLEPFFTTHKVDMFLCHKFDTDPGLDDFTADATAAYVQSLFEQKKAVTEVYKSSMLTESGEFGVPNKALERLVALVEYEPRWCGGIEMFESMGLEHVGCKHCAVFPLYFSSYGRPPPALLSPSFSEGADAGSALRGCTVPSPGCTDGEIRQWVQRQVWLGGGQRWVQRAGRGTLDPGDDAFVVRPSLAGNLEAVRGEALSFAAAREESRVIWWRRRGGTLAWAVGAPLAGLVLGGACCVALRARRAAEVSASSDDDDAGRHLTPQQRAREFRRAADAESGEE